MPAIDTQHGKKAPPRRSKPKAQGPPNFPSYVPPRPGAVKVKRAPKSGSGVAPNFPTYVPKRPGAYEPPKAKPKHSAVGQSRIAEQQYHSQAGAVRRAAKTQQTPGLGVGSAVRPAKGGRQVLTQARLNAVRDLRATHAREQSYKSLGESVAKQAEAQRVKNQATGKTKVQMVGEGGKKVTKLIDTALVSKDPKVQKAAGLTKGGALDEWMNVPGAAMKNAPKDLAELAVTTPTSMAHFGYGLGKGAAQVYGGNIKGAGKTYAKLGKEFIEPYKQAAKDPAKFVGEHPVTSYLMFAPTVKVPLRLGAKALRVREGIAAERAVAKGKTPKPKKHTRVREQATLPGTALKENRTASAQPFGLDLMRKIRGQQEGGRVTAPELKRAVDEHADQARHREERRVAEAVKAKRQEFKDLPKHERPPKHERQQAIHDAGEHAREQARIESQQVFARRVGSNLEPQTTIADVARAEAERAQAKQHKGLARRTVEHAKGLVEQAKARNRDPYSLENAPDLHALEMQREGAIKDLADSQARHATTRVNLAEAKGRAATSVAKPKSSPKLKDLEEQRKRVEQSPPVAASREAVAEARSAVSAADRKVNLIERQVQRAEERASHLEGVTVGRHKAGAMTARAGRAAADQAERVGHLYDALHEAHTEAQAARLHLKTVEKAHRGVVRDAAKVIDQGIRDERRRIAGVAPDAADSLLSAIERRDTAAGRTHASRQVVRGLDQQILEARDAARQRTRAGVAQAVEEHGRAVEQHRTSVEVHRRLRDAAVETARQHREGPLANPTGEGRLFDNPHDAKVVAKQLNAQGHTIPSGAPAQLHLREPTEGWRRRGGEGKPVSLTIGQGNVPLKFRVKKVGEDQWSVQPKIASQRMYGGGGKGAELSHASVGSGKATGARFLRTTRGALSKAVLGLSLKWLWGQGAEAAIRAAVGGAGPADFVRFNRIVKRMNELEPGAGDALKDRMLGGQYDPHGAIGQQVLGTKTLASEYEGTAAPFATAAKAATWIGHAPGIKQARGTIRGLTRFTMQGVNGLIENTAKKAMAGQVIRDSHLMEMRVALPKLHGLTEKAIDDAARGLLETPNQVEAARGLNEMYGKYRDQSPEMKSLLQHWTPFLPWYLNTARFLFHTLPSRHPLKAGLLASMVEADRDWRMQHGLSFYRKPGGKEHVPDFLLGSYPNPKNPDRYWRVGHYTPWGVGADPLGAVSDLALPQLTGSWKNLGGVDWKWQPLTKPGKKGEKRRPFNMGERLARATLTGVESQIPGVQIADRLSGLGAKYVDKRPDDRSVLERLKAESPTTSTKAPKKKGKKPKATDPFGGTLGSGGDLLGGSMGGAGGDLLGGGGF